MFIVYGYIPRVIPIISIFRITCIHTIIPTSTDKGIPNGLGKENPILVD